MAVMTDHDEIFAQMKARVPEGISLELPPRIIIDQEGQFLSFDPEAMTMRVRFPVLERTFNPLRQVQGGAIAAMLDSTMGPLTYLVAPPSVTMGMNITYLRPLTENYTHVEVEAWVSERTRQFLHTGATAYSPDGKTLVSCTATSYILGL